jgi:hypothetical protein
MSQVVEDAKTIFDAVNKALAEMGAEQFTDRESLQAVIYIAIREDSTGGLLIGRANPVQIVQSILAFLVKNKFIDEEFATEIYVRCLADLFRKCQMEVEP